MQLRAEFGGQDFARLIDEHFHLVGDEADIGIAGSDDRERRAVADAGDEDERVFHLDDHFVDRAAAEATRGAVGETDETRGNCGESIG